MISVFGSQVGDEELAHLRESIESSWLGMGKKVAAFENKFGERLGLDHFLLVDSGSNALYMAVASLELPPGSEIIVPSFTWVSCAQAILLAGHKPVFCDVEPSTGNCNAELIEPWITPKTGAIMIVHYAGYPVDMDPILALGLPVIEDAAHAVDSQYKGKYCGAIGDVGIYSFDAVKNLTAGEGGGIAFNSQERYEKAKKLRYCGIGKSGFQQSQELAHSKNRWWEYNISDVFIKMLPTDLAAGIGLAQLEKIDNLQARRKVIWERYQEAFADSPVIQRMVDLRPGDKHSYFTYLIQVPRRDDLAYHLLDKKIYTTLRYHPLHLNALYGQLDKDLEGCNLLNERGLNIPLHPNLTDDEVEYIIASIIEFYS